MPHRSRGASRDPDSISAVRGVKPAALLVPLGWRWVGAGARGRVWRWAQLLAAGDLPRRGGMGQARRRGEETPGAPSLGASPGRTPQHPPSGQLFPVIYKKESFGMVVSFPRKNIFAALIIPVPDRRKAVPKHGFL